MLYLDEPIGPIKGLMIYRDQQNKSLFHYVPERPRLARNDGVPEFVLLKYKRDITDNPNFDPETKQALGGGLLSFTVDLSIDDEQLQEVKRELSQFAEGTVQLAPIQFRKGSVRLSISKDEADSPDAEPDQPRGLRFFEEVYGTNKPSLFGFNRATFTVVLGQEEVTLFEEGFRSGVSPIGVIYDLEFLGLRPAFNVRITADYERIYTQLEIGLAARGQIQVISLAAEINLAFQRLREEGVIKVEVVNFTDDADLRKQADEAFKWFKQDLLKDLFKTALEPPSFMKQPAGQGLVGQLQNLFRGLAEGQTGSSRPQRTTPTTAPVNAASGASTMQSAAPSTTQTNRAVSNAATQGEGSGSSGENRGLSPFQIAFTLKYLDARERRKRTFEYSMQAAVAREAAPQGLFSTMIEGIDLGRAIKSVSLDDDFFKRLVATVTMGTNLEAAGISSVAVNLEYPGERFPAEEPTHVDGFVFSPSNLAPKTFTTWLNDRKSLDYRYKMDVFFRPDSAYLGKDDHVLTDWIVTRTRQLPLDPLGKMDLFTLEISLGEIDSDEVSQVQVECLYEDTNNDFEAQKAFLLKPNEASQHWRLRLSDADQNTYKYRVTYFLKDNLRVQTDWQDSQDPSLIINEPFRNTFDIRLVPLLDQENLVEAIVDMTYRDEETGYERRLQEVFSPTAPEGLNSRPISIPTLTENPENYTYELTVIRLDGSVYQSEPVISNDSVILITDGPGRTRRIRVNLGGQDMISAGLIAVKVNLTGPGDQPDRESVIFSPSQHREQTVSLVQPHEGDVFTYSYKVTGYNIQGEALPGDSGESSDTTLFIRMPAPS
jgi:hypothetical protein